jgi:hypothetical protein
MKKSFSFSTSTNFSINGRSTSKHVPTDGKLTPQQEYWLNRFLREYANKVFFLIVLFLILLFGIVIVAGHSNTTQGNNKSQIEFSLQ